MSVFGILGVIFALAFLVETLVETVLGAPFDKIQALMPYKWLLMYAALGVGVAGAFVYRFDLLALLAQFLQVELLSTPFGVALTGLAIGRGAGYMHDFVSRYFKKPVEA